MRKIFLISSILFLNLFWVKPVWADNNRSQTTVNLNSLGVLKLNVDISFDPAIRIGDSPPNYE